MGDETRLAQVIDNLISNATKFSPEGEEVTISVGSIDGGIGVRDKDKAPGIPEDFRKQLFDRFTQVDSSTTKKAPGTGLGPAICKHIIDGHNGIIDVESEEGNGSAFYFVLPDAAPPPQPPANDTKAA
ncbi:MAG: HAMP domain-containing sensor histidine kinase [Rhodospirillaceae bacterium]